MPSYTARAARAAAHRTIGMRYTTECALSTSAAAIARLVWRRVLRRRRAADGNADRTEPRSCTEGCRARTECQVRNRLRRIIH
jgi:hypothetical protein